VGQPITISYTVTTVSGSPIGNVTVRDDEGASCTAAASDGECLLTFSSVGKKTLTATYEGAFDFYGSSDSVLHTVEKASTTTAISGHDPSPSIAGQEVTVSFTVAVTPPGAGVLTGGVTVEDGEGHTCSTTVNQGVCRLTPSSKGSKTISATYEGDGNYLGSSDSVSHLVNNELPSGTILINGGALATTSLSVTLTISADDDSGIPPEMQFSNDSSEWSAFESLIASKPWMLSKGDGQKTVFARFRDITGEPTVPVSDTITLDTLAGDEYGVTVNGGALFTNQITVTLTLGAKPYTTQMQVSNDGGFSGTLWEAYNSQTYWTITQYGNYVIPRVVYVRYKDMEGDVSSTFQDDIILDVTAPNGWVEVITSGTNNIALGISASNPASIRPSFSTLPNHRIVPAQHLPFTVFIPQMSKNILCYPPTGEPNVTLRLYAEDDVSGVAGMMISHLPNFPCAIWQPYITTKAWFAPPGASMVYVKFRDYAGNVSEVVSDEIP